MITPQAFFRRWKKEFSPYFNARSRAIPNFSFWEGEDVCRELRRTKLLNTVALRPASARLSARLPNRVAWFSRELRRMIGHEIRTYSRFANDLVRTNRELADVRLFLTGTMRRLLKEKQRCSRAETKNVLDECVIFIKHEIKQLNRAQREKWELPRGVYGAVLREPKYRRYPARERDIDQRFQIRVAKLLRLFLRKKDGVSLRTIARLVILVYIASGLAEVQNDQLIISRTKKTPPKMREKSPSRTPQVAAMRLTVGAVSERLTRAGLDRTPSGDAVDIAGAWRLIEIQNLPAKLVRRMTIQQEGEKIYGALEYEGVEENFEGKVNDYRINFRVKRNLPRYGQAMVEYAGTIGSYSLEGTMKSPTPQTGNVRWTALPLGNQHSSRATG